MQKEHRAKYKIEKMSKTGENIKHYSVYYAINKHHLLNTEQLLHTYNFKHHCIRRGYHGWKLNFVGAFQNKFWQSYCWVAILCLRINAEFWVQGGKWSKYFANLNCIERRLRLSVCVKIFQNGAVYRWGSAVELYSLATIIWLKCLCLPLATEA